MAKTHRYQKNDGYPDGYPKKKKNKKQFNKDREERRLEKHKNFNQYSHDSDDEIIDLEFEDK